MKWLMLVLMTVIKWELLMEDLLGNWMVSWKVEMLDHLLVLQLVQKSVD